MNIKNNIIMKKLIQRVKTDDINIDYPFVRNLVF